MEQKRKYVKPSMKAMKIDSSNMIMSSGAGPASSANEKEREEEK